jgi:hypothetical protein
MGVDENENPNRIRASILATPIDQAWVQKVRDDIRGYIRLEYTDREIKWLYFQGEDFMRRVVQRYKNEDGDGGESSKNNGGDGHGGGGGGGDDGNNNDDVEFNVEDNGGDETTTTTTIVMLLLEPTVFQLQL